MAEFRLHPEDWPHLEALQEAGGSMRMRDIEPRAFTNLKVCGMVTCRDADGAITIALTPAGYALLAERERWRERIAQALLASGVSNEMALRIAVEMEVARG